ncbi:MAG TPA: TIGR03086 family metal-binding protein [Acidimicrobiales bacterium]
MDRDLPELHARALDATTKVVAGVGSGQWDTFMETANTTVRMLVGHMVGENSQVATILSGQPVEPYRGVAVAALLGEDPKAAWDRAAASAVAAFRVPGALDATCPVNPAAPMTGVDYCGNRFVDVLVHGWEVANVTGQDSRLDPELAEAARSVIEPSILKLRAEGIIREAVAVPDGASAQTRLLSYFGFEG